MRSRRFTGLPRAAKPGGIASLSLAFFCLEKERGCAEFRDDRDAAIHIRMRPKRMPMAKLFKVGDHVSWNSEAGRVTGRIVRLHTKNVNYKGYVHHATKAEPQYEIKSDKTDHIALHKGTALRHMRH